MDTHLPTRRAVVAGTALLALTALAAPALAQPSNDAFADATAVTALPFTDSVDLTGASTEQGEPSNPCAPVAGSVWYAVRLDAYAVVEVSTAGSTADTVLGVYEGDSLDDLHLVHCSDDFDDSPQAGLSLEAFPDLTVYVQAGVFGETVPAGSQLEIAFTESVEPPPPPIKGNRPLRRRIGEQVDFATAEWVSLGETSSTITSLIAFDGMWYADWGPDHRTHAQQIQLFHTHKELNERTGETVRTEYESFALLPRKAFVFESSMRGARLQADVETFAYQCVTPPGGDEDDTTCTELGYPPAHIDVGWQGWGKIYRDRFADRFIFPDERLFAHGRVTIREAHATGTLTVEDVAKPLADGPADTFEYLVRGAEHVSYWARD